MGPDNLPVVNEDLCTGCGTCERVCPKHIITLSSATRRIVDEYETDECTAPCQRACPTGINIPRFINEINNGYYEKALLTIKEKCALPLVCGYICPAPCELNCRRNLVDEAVAINPLKRFVADYEIATGKHIQPYKAPDNEKKVALIGGGSEGLTASYYLARLGYQPTIFEAKPKLGGILRYVIAEDRLPRKILDHEIKGILDMGVTAKTETVMGRDFTVGSLLKEGYEAVVLTSGGFDSRKILQPEPKRYDSAVQGLFMMLDFIKLMAQDKGLVKEKQVVIASAGQKELEIARQCLESGAKKVTLITTLPSNLLPMELRDRKALAAEGIEVKFQTMINDLSGIEDKLEQITIEEIDPVNPAMSQAQSIPADVLVLAAGRLPELTFFRLDEDEESTDSGLKWKTVETFKAFPESAGYGILSSPEPGRISDSSAVVKSILSGRRLARAIHQYFDNDEIVPIENLACETDKIISITEVQNVQSVERQRQAFIDVEGNSKTAWLYPKEFPGLEEVAARREADRCLQCGLICYKKSA
jgi:NADPH-dependent glutamate synthase beta subunit-like oxidoreductase